MYFDTIIAGFGGQGVMFIGNLLALAAMKEDKNTTYMPVYGVEMRGGTANCSVVISDRKIGSPILHNPLSGIVMNVPSLEKFGPAIKKKGLLLVNTSLVDMSQVNLKGIQILAIPAIDMAREVGRDQLANMIMLGALVEKSKVVQLKSIMRALEESLPKNYHQLLPINRRSLEAGADFARSR
jgi:2-oxoglutarate ferredoxin oxidoreductase subunit gamma